MKDVCGGTMRYRHTENKKQHVGLDQNMKFVLLLVLYSHVLFPCLDSHHLCHDVNRPHVSSLKKQPINTSESTQQIALGADVWGVLLQHIRGKLCAKTSAFRTSESLADNQGVTGRTAVIWSPWHPDRERKSF